MEAARGIEVGTPLLAQRGRRIGTVDAVFAITSCVRTASLLPSTCTSPRRDVLEDGRLRVSVGRREAYERWHRPIEEGTTRL
jgi:hypothetical protein